MNISHSSIVAATVAGSALWPATSVVAGLTPLAPAPASLQTESGWTFEVTPIFGSRVCQGTSTMRAFGVQKAKAVVRPVCSGIRVGPSAAIIAKRSTPASRETLRPHTVAALSATPRHSTPI